MRVLALASILVTGIFLLAVFEPARVRVTGRLVARSVLLQLARGAQGGAALNVELALPFERGVARLGAFSSILPPPPASSPGAMPGGNAPTGPGGAANLVVSSTQTRLVGLRIAEGGTLRLTLSGPKGRLMRVMAGGGGAFDLETTGSAQLRVGHGTAWRTNEDDTGIVTVRGEGGGAAPMVLEGRIAGIGAGVGAGVGADADDAAPDFSLDDVRVDLLRFGRETGVADATPFVSSIESGEIMLVGTGDKLPLDAGSPLQLDGFEGHVVHLALRRDGWQLVFTGRARHVLMGPVGFNEDVTPSLLAVLYHIQWVQLACAAIVTTLTTVGAAIFAIKDET